MPIADRPGSPLAGLAPVRLAVVLGVSAGLHWGALAAVDGLAVERAERPGTGGTGATTVVYVPAVATREGTPATRVAASRPASDPERWAPVEVVATAARAARTAPARDAARPDDTATGAGRRGGRAADDAPSTVAAPTWLEVSQVDDPPQFLVPPASLDDLPALAGRALDLGVALRVGADGRLLGIEVDLGPDGDEATRATLHGAVLEAFADVRFMPARRDGRAVPVVLRWHVALDPHAPIALGFVLAN